MKEEIKKLENKIDFQLKKIEEIPEVIKRRKIINAIHKQKKALIDSCKHPNALAYYDGNTGGYDGPNFDTYWVDVKCPDCSRRFHFDSNEKGYTGNYKKVDRYDPKAVRDFEKM